jgi:hypothetical protein
MDFDKKKYKLHQLYLKQLDKTMKEYPPYKVGEKNTYNKDLSLLNGISKQISELHQAVQEKMASMSRMIQRSDTAIEQIKKIETNLSNYTTMDELDITSRQMLEDAQQEYDDKKILFFIKLAVFLLFSIFLIFKKRYIALGLCILIGGILSFFNNLLVNKIAQ